jgi:hypothetical protein
MRRIFVTLLITVFCFLAADAYAKIIINAPPEVPLNLDSRDFKNLMAESNSLSEQFYATQQKIYSQEGNCKSVEENSPKVSECRSEAQEVKSAVRKYREAVKEFNAMIAEAVAWQKAKEGIFNKNSVSANPDPIAAKPPEDIQHFVTADGLKLDGKDVRLTSENGNEIIATGPDGYALLKFPDGTIIKLGPGSTFVPKIHEPAPVPDKNPTMELVKGKLRWVHEHAHEIKKELNENDGETRARLIREGKIRVSTFAIAVQGTEFECVALPDGSGNIKLYSGALSVTSKTGEVVTLTPGQMITFTKDKAGPVTPVGEDVSK